MTRDEVFGDIANILADLENRKVDFDIEEWAITTLTEFRVTDSIKCVVCGFEKPEVDMLKVFKVWTNGKETTNKGICKRCWNYDGECL
jgi:hypothetical protein